jgi:hypothetical protein
MEATVFENFKNFGESGEINYKTNFTCSICGKFNQNYIDLNNILICKECLSNWINLLDNIDLKYIQKCRG